MALFRVVYVIAALVSIGAVCFEIVDVVRGKVKLTDHMFSGKMLLVFLAVGICTVWDTWSTLHSYVPDGAYDVHVAVRCSEWDADRYLPANLFISTDTYDDGKHLSSETTYTLASITFGDGNREYVDINIQPGKTVKADIGNTVYTITLSDISPKSLGITPRDNWDRSSTFAKICNAGVPILCAAGLVQGLRLDKKKEDM